MIYFYIPRSKLAQPQLLFVIEYFYLQFLIYIVFLHIKSNFNNELRWDHNILYILHFTCTRTITKIPLQFTLLVILYDFISSEAKFHWNWLQRSELLCFNTGLQKIFDSRPDLGELEKMVICTYIQN